MTKFNQQSLNWQKVSGLMPAIIQDDESKAILMLGYMNNEALTKTQETGLVTFYSRSRNCLWTKGETSGNYLNLVSLKEDCDGDTLLVSAKPAGPTCHKGWDTCFEEKNTAGIGFINTLNQTISERADQSPEESYTAKLLSMGTKRIAQKVGEEAVEVAIAATAGEKDELIEESADLLYHLLVLWKSQDVEINQVINCLKQRSN